MDNPQVIIGFSPKPKEKDLKPFFYHTKNAVIAGYY